MPSPGNADPEEVLLLPGLLDPEVDPEEVPDSLLLLTWEVEVPPPGIMDPEDWLLLPRLLEPEDKGEADEP